MPEVLTETALSGRELDTAVAERVMGWRLINRRAMGWNPNGPDVWATGDADNPSFQSFEPSRSIEAAMEVVEKMREQHWCIDMMNQFRKGPQWAVSFEGVEANDIRDVSAASDSLPTAICLAALKAMESKDGNVMPKVQDREAIRK